jgi:hypothetical protein
MQLLHLFKHVKLIFIFSQMEQLASSNNSVPFTKVIIPQSILNFFKQQEELRKVVEEAEGALGVTHREHNNSLNSTGTHTIANGHTYHLPIHDTDAISHASTLLTPTTLNNNNLLPVPDPIEPSDDLTLSGLHDDTSLSYIDDITSAYQDVPVEDQIFTVGEDEPNSFIPNDDGELIESHPLANYNSTSDIHNQLKEIIRSNSFNADSSPVLTFLNSTSSDPVSFSSSNSSTSNTNTKNNNNNISGETTWYRASDLPRASAEIPNSFYNNTKNEQYLDVTPYLNMPQKDAAGRLGIPTSTLSKRWKDAVKQRKWPYRIVSKLDREIMVLLQNIQVSLT